MSEVALYGYWRSSSSWRVRIALEWKEISYAYKAVHLLEGGGQQHSEEHVQRNPSHLIPTLCIDGHTLNQSLAILEYLEEKYPERPLLPADPSQRAKVREIVGMIACDIQPIQNLRVLQKVGLENKLEWGAFWIEKGLQYVENVLEKTAGTCCVGDEVSMADLCLIPQLYNANRFKVDLSAFPVTQRVAAHLEALPAFAKAHPSAQPDAQAP